MGTARKTLRLAAIVIGAGAGLAVPSGAMAALSTHSATTTTPDSAGQLVATAKCGAGEHVVSGGWKSLKGDREGAAVVSRAAGNKAWTVRLHPDNPDKLVTFAYCASKGTVSQHAAKANAHMGPAFTIAKAHCGAGQSLVSGGYAFLGTPSLQNNSPTFKDYALTRSTWTVLSVIEHVPAKLEAFAYCESGVKVKVRSSTGASIPKHANGSATASCHKGETLLSGGYTTKPRPDWQNSSGPDFFYYASYRSGSRSWTASAHNYSHAAGKITAFAYCTG